MTNLCCYTGLTQNIPNRESSRSPPPPRERSRPVPAGAPSAQMYAPQTAAQQVNQIPPQASPTGSNTSRPSPPIATIQRHHVAQSSVSSGESGLPPSISQIPPNHNNYNAHYAQTLGRTQVPSLTRYQSFDDDYHITPELLEEIERADLQQAQTHSGSPAFKNYPRNGSATPPVDQTINRVRVADRASPKDLDSRRQRDSIPARESPTVRQTHSPTAFAQVQGSNPDRRTSDSPARASPLGGSSGETYAPYMTRDSPPIHRRTSHTLNSEPRGQYSIAAQSPPLQSTQARSSDRSLPVQEEPEDDTHLTAKNDPWNGLEHLDNTHRSSSPTPSSDLHPEGNQQRFDTKRPDPRAHQYQDDSETEGAKTPRSPSVGLPDKNVQPTPGGTRPALRTSSRTSSMDQYGLRGIDQTMYQPTPDNDGPESSQSSSTPRNEQSPQRKLNVDPNPHFYQTQYYADESSPYSALYHGGQFYPEDYQAYGDPSQFYQDVHHGERPRPDAPIPPTPHSQTAAPSPSPFPNMYPRNGRAFHAPSPIAPAGSPYPYPFEHVRRNLISRNARPHMFDPRDPNFDINVIRDQVAGQWQKFAQNTHALGNMSDSTFSPSTTPFQGNFAPWASLHARRTLGRALDLRSMQSSPALERQEHPEPPPSVVFRSKKNKASRLSTDISGQVAPPRVQSTQPRDTSPEPSTSGEETAGEEQYSTANPSRSSWGNGTTPDRVVEEEDGDGDWVDEDDEADEDDLLELEYHPSYVKNVAKRRRRWEIGWEALLESVSVKSDGPH